MLSPMLFFIMMEVFSRMLRRVEGAGIIYFKAEVLKLREEGVVGNVFHIYCLQMTLFIL